MEKDRMTPGRLRFSNDHDVLLLQQGLSINPWSKKKGEGWMTIARNLSYVPPYYGPLFPRTVRERLNLLVDKFALMKRDPDKRDPQSLTKKEFMIKECWAMKEKANSEAPLPPEKTEDPDEMTMDEVQQQLFQQLTNQGTNTDDCDQRDLAVKEQLRQSIINSHQMPFVVEVEGESFEVHREGEEHSMNMAVNTSPGDYVTQEAGEGPCDAAEHTYASEQGKRKGRKRKKNSCRELMMHLLEKELSREKERKEELEIRRMELQLTQDRQDFEMKLRKKEIEMRELREEKELESRLERERMDLEQRRRDMNMQEERHKREMELRSEQHRLEMEHRKQEIRLREETERLALEERRFFLNVLKKNE